MPRLTDLAHLIIGAALRPGDVAVDATVGNGHDTAFLIERVGPRGSVFGFDVQARAIHATRARVGAGATLFEASHADIRSHLPADTRGRVGAVMFNLGYLPGGDKAIMTEPHSTLAALDATCGLLRVGGVLSVMVYPAHAGGDVEADAVAAWMQICSDAFGVTHHATIARRRDHAFPELYVVTRRS